MTPERTDERITRAAELMRVPVEDFIAAAAVDRAELVLRQHDALLGIGAPYAEELREALETPAPPKAGLARAALRAQQVLSRRGPSSEATEG